MKAKVKPVDKSDIRERVEKKFRARGAVVFHLLVMLGAGILLIYHLPELWLTRRSSDGFRDSTIPYVLLSAAGALHFIRYYFRHGRGRDRHEQETEARIARQLQGAAAEEAEEQEELIRLQMGDKLKNRRLVLQHATIYAAVILLMLLLHLRWLRNYEIFDWSSWADIATVAGIWGMGLAAHVLRYVFAYGFAAERREAKIEAQVARELRQTEGGRAGGALGIEDERAEDLAIEDIVELQTRESRLPAARSKADA